MKKIPCSIDILEEYGGHLVPLTEPWLEAVWHLFLKTALNGWTDTAHLDQTFLSANGNVTITLEITHP